MACEDTRQLTEAQRVAGYQNGRTGVPLAVRPFSGRPTIENLIDYINRELQPAVRRTRDAVNDVYLQVADNAPSGNPLGYYFSTETGNADPTAGRVRLNQATQDTATIIRVSESNGRLVDVAPWLDVMAGSVTSPLGVVTLTDAINPARFIRFDLTAMADAGAYWNLTVSPIESSHDNPFVDGGAIVLSFIPGVGGGTAATIPPTAISGADGPRQFLSTSTGTTVDWRTLNENFPGAPIYDVMAYPFNAVGNGVADDTAALNAAIAAANAAPGWIYLGRNHRITAALTPIANHNIAIQGRGHFNGGSAISVDAAAAADWITVDQVQYVKIRDVWIRGVGALYTTGAAIRLYGAFRTTIERVLITQLANGIDVHASGPTDIRAVIIGDIYGSYGIYQHGDAPFVSHALEVVRTLVSTSFPASQVGFASTWQAATAYVVGNVVSNGGNLYQVVTAGTSGGTGPTGVPGTTVATAHTATITDGSVVWVWAMGEYTSYLFDSYAATCRLLDSGALQGGYGVRMIDSSGGANSPNFLRCVNLELDHVARCGVSLEGGGQAEFEQTFITSMLNGPAIQVLSTFEGIWRFNGGVLFASGVELVTIAGSYGQLSDMIICGGGLFGANTYDAVRVDANTEHFEIQDCIIGEMAGDLTPDTRYGISIASGCDNYSVQGNILLGHDTGAILNTPGTSSTRIVRNNIPDVEMLEKDESGAGPFDSYDLTGARHVVCTNAAGVFLGVINSGVVGETLIFSHQGAGYTEFQHNASADPDDCFFTGRLGKSLRIYDNETAVFRLLDTVGGATTITRWVLVSPQFPFAHASDDALGDVKAHNGSHFVTVSSGGDASLVLLGNATFGAVPATAIAEVEETGAGPFNDYSPATANARHIMCSNAAGVFTGVSATGYVVGDEIIFSHQGTGYTEFQHNTGSAAGNLFFTGRQGRNLRIFDNEMAVFRYVDTVSGVTTTRRWELQSPLFPWAQSSADAAGDITMHNGTNYIAVQPYSTSIVRNGTTIERAALTGEVTASQNGNVTTITRSTNFTWTGVHSHTGSSHTVNVTGAVAIDADASSHLATSVGDVTVESTDAAGNVNLSSFGGSPGGAEIRMGAQVVVEAATQFRVSTGNPLVERLEVEPDGAWQVNGSTGTAETVLTTSGASASPEWGGAALFANRLRLNGIQNLSTGTQQDDLSVTAANVLRVDLSAANVNLTGMVAGGDGQVLIIVNIGSTNSLRVVDERDATAGTASTAANRFNLQSNTSLDIRPREMGIFWYDGTVDRWHGGRLNSTA